MICAEFEEWLIKDGWILYREAIKKGLIQDGVPLEVAFQNADGERHVVYTSKVSKFCRNWIDCLFNNKKGIIAVKKRNMDRHIMRSTLRGCKRHKEVKVYTPEYPCYYPH